MNSHSESGILTALTGTERFTEGGTPLSFTVLDYWRWSESDLVSRTQHRKIAEYLVAAAVGATDTPFAPTLPYAMLDPRGIAIVVSVHSDIIRFAHQMPSPIAFSCYPYRISGVPAEAQSGEPARQDGAHVFAHLTDKNLQRVNPLDVSDWEFYVVPTRLLGERWPGEREVSLEQLQTTPYGDPVAYAALSDAVAARALLFNVGARAAPLPVAAVRSLEGVMSDKPPVRAMTPVTEAESFTDSGKPLPMSVLDFWQWRSSDLLSNPQRAQLTSFLVANALGTPNVPPTYLADDSIRDAQGRRISVRSQVVPAPWEEIDPSALELWCPPTKEWNDFPGSDPIRRAHLYVFALLINKGVTLNPLDLSQWDLYVVPTGFLDEHWPTDRSVRLVELQPTPYGEPVPYRALDKALAERAQHYPVRPARSPVETKAIETDAALLLAHADALGLDFRSESLRGWNHMGAVIVNAALAFYSPRGFVRSRVLKVKHAWPDAVSTSGLLARLKSVDLAEFLDFDDEPLLQQIRRLAQLFGELAIETVDDFRQTLTNRESRDAIRAALAPAYHHAVPAVGTFEILVGLVGYITTDEFSGFADDAGIIRRANNHYKNVMNAAAASRGAPVENVYSAIWAYDGVPKR